MRFGRQTFLNPPSSDDSGYVKFSIRPREAYRDRASRKRYTPAGHQVTWQIADCNEKIFLEFGYGGMLDTQHYATEEHEVREMLTKIKARRAKMRKFVKAVTDAAEVYFKALDHDEQTMLDYLDNKKSYEKDKAYACAAADRALADRES